ncbi:hypothetical protein TIFTF001_020605 [Ficus carica]|uniref:Uncharacterized protein n=1 Tax=Ficus carica TaxID=3494 RepID=A0AA88DCS4_FICCA|nr:hypothetical protein TIFTF001_020605 [Ficus carica]
MVGFAAASNDSSAARAPTPTADRKRDISIPTHGGANTGHLSSA